MSFSQRDKRPLYLQIADDLRNKIISGALREGDKIPSVRELAAEHSINPNTIQRSMRELENEGIIETIAGKGCFVASLKVAKNTRRAELTDLLKKTCRELAAMGMTSEDLIDILKGETDDQG